MRSIRSHLTYANVVATLALFIALGGVSYAALKLPRNSVGGAQIKDGAVANSDLAANAVTGKKVKAASLDGSDIQGAVTSATTATTATTAGTATALERIAFRTATVTVPAWSGSGTYPTATATAQCESGQTVIAGGVNVDTQNDLWINDDHPNGTDGWTAVVASDAQAPHEVTVTAICTMVKATGR